MLKKGTRMVRHLEVKRINLSRSMFLIEINFLVLKIREMMPTPLLKLAGTNLT
jgi:hypothetical protein